MLAQGALASSALAALPGGSGIAFDAATNSGYQTAQSTYSWSHTCTGSNRFLTVGISMLSVGGSSVSGITFNGVALSLIRAKASAAGAVRAELWGLVAPATGSNTIAVTLSTALDSIGGAVSFTGVSQTSATEADNDATALNVGAADATVDVTTVADKDLVIDVVASSDTAITVGSGQTSRNNVTGTLGSGAMSTEPKTPAGAVTMSWTDVGAAQTWTIVAAGIRPVTASVSATLAAAVGAFALTGVAALQKITRASAVGAFVLTGVAAVQKITRASAVGAFVLTGVAALQKITRASAVGAFALTGVAAILSHGYKFMTAVGAFTLTGVAAVQKITRASAVGAFVLTGVAALQRITKVAAAGAFVLTGVAATLSFGHVLTAVAGAFTFTGKSAGLAAKRFLNLFGVRRNTAAALNTRRQQAEALAKQRTVDPTLTEKRESAPSLTRKSWRE